MKRSAMRVSIDQPSTELRKWFSHDPEKWASSVGATSVNLPHNRKPGSRSCPRLGVAESRSFTAHTTRNTTMRSPCRSSCERRPAGRHGRRGRARRAGRGARRGDSRHGSPQAAHSFCARPIPPFRLDLTAWALRRRPRNLIDRWDGTTYRRVIVMDGRPTELALRQTGSSAAPRLHVTTTPPPQTPLERRRVRSIVDRLLGLRIDLTDWSAWPRVMRGCGARRHISRDEAAEVPTMFEALVNGFACQQLSLEVGLELLNRLATISSARFGRRGDVRYAFPTAHDIARLSAEKYRRLGSVVRRFAHSSVSPCRSHGRNRISSWSRGRRCCYPTTPARIAWRRTVDCRIRAITRPRTSARVSWR